MRFSISLDVILLKSVLSVDAHLSAHGETKANFEEVLKLFEAGAPNGMFNRVSSPTWKSVNDRYKKLISDHRTAVKRNINASGIIEVRGEREVLLDDIVLAVDENDEKRRAERDE